LPARAQRIGLSATVRPLDEVATFLSGRGRTSVVAPPFEKEIDLSVVVPVEDLTAIGETLERHGEGSPEERTSVWPSIERRLVELVREQRSSIVFANARGMAERLCARLNPLAPAELATAPHAPVTRPQP